MGIIEHLKKELETLVTGEASLEQLVNFAKSLKTQGHSREQVVELFEASRSVAPSEAVEDRILEVLDFVTGFCIEENRIFDE